MVVNVVLLSGSSWPSLLLKERCHPIFCLQTQVFLTSICGKAEVNSPLNSSELQLLLLPTARASRASTLQRRYSGRKEGGLPWALSCPVMSLAQVPKFSKSYQFWSLESSCDSSYWHQLTATHKLSFTERASVLFSYNRAFWACIHRQWKDHGKNVAQISVTYRSLSAALSSFGSFVSTPI